jgi:hypothetical protein
VFGDKTKGEEKEDEQLLSKPACPNLLQLQSMKKVVKALVVVLENGPDKQNHSTQFGSSA